MDVRRDVRGILLSIPRQDRFEIGGQITRASWSIPCNIAEGHSRAARQDYKNFLSYSRGSVGELYTQMIALGEDHQDVSDRSRIVRGRLIEVERMVTAIMQKL
jgi:four helix bundle protein